ncbi:hypothetical protein MBLNU230_g8360t1 [Neophaeotheca triangularis]
MAFATLSPLGVAAPQTDNGTTTTAPRKRRRRTGTTGATDDCFTCRKRSVKCDRKRPYCSSCMDTGKECAGYKTTLTWGVGVASRGKLRGMACPVANKNIDGSDATPQQTEARRRKSSVSKVKREHSEVETNPLHTLSDAASIAGAASLSRASHSDSLTSHSMPIEIPQAQGGWNGSAHQEHLDTRSMVYGNNHKHPNLERLHTSLEPSYDTVFPQSANSMNSYTGSDYHSPLEFSRTPNSLRLPDAFQFYQRTYGDRDLSGSSIDSLRFQGDSYGSYDDSYGSSLDSRIGQDGNGTVNPSQTEMSFNNVIYPEAELNLETVPEEQFNMGTFGLPNEQQDHPEYEHKGMTFMNMRFGATALQLSPRLRTLLDYYDRNVCPFLVAFDGPSNPYRMHVLQLAMQNEGLQSAIAALATNNMRMRRKQPQSIGYIEELDPNNEPTPEETCYKSMSIDQLNMQLSDPRAAQDDSVLATLLILCLFHVCDSGFSKFKTQLAGVQRLLSMRDPATQSGFTGWIETFFTWFDVMTSTVNDRETQIRGDSLDMLDFSANLGTLEHYSGCDGRLFKIIARLGRLNLLSQNRPVRNDAAEETPRASPKPHDHYAASHTNGSGPFSALDYANLDGNGWCAPVFPMPEEITDSADTNPAYDERKLFWSEWHDIQRRLQTWQIDLATLPVASPDTTQLAPPDPNAPLTQEQTDLIHISESFRFSALLYIERLAHPLLPSSAPNFQALVSQSLYHMTALDITSCVNKFLLWPLFITGTECVDEETQRSVVRDRCIEIQKESGFFNNLSGLEVLERVWRDANPGGIHGELAEVTARRMDAAAGRDGRFGQAFRWRKAMDRVDGEYILI